MYIGKKYFLLKNVAFKFFNLLFLFINLRQAFNDISHFICVAVVHIAFADVVMCIFSNGGEFAMVAQNKFNNPFSYCKK